MTISLPSHFFYISNLYLVFRLVLIFYKLAFSILYSYHLIGVGGFAEQQTHLVIFVGRGL